MSQLSSDLHVLGGILSDLFDGKANLTQVGHRMDALNAVIGTQLKDDAGKVFSVLGPQATAEIKNGMSAIQGAAGTVLDILDADVAPYMASGAKAVEGAVDTVLNAAVPGTAALNPLINGGIDAIAAGLKAAIDAQTAAWKAKLTANSGAPASPVPAAAPAA